MIIFLGIIIKRNLVKFRASRSRDRKWGTLFWDYSIRDWSLSAYQYYYRQAKRNCLEEKVEICCFRDSIVCWFYTMDRRCGTYGGLDLALFDDSV